MTNLDIVHDLSFWMDGEPPKAVALLIATVNNAYISLTMIENVGIYIHPLKPMDPPDM